MANRSYKKDGVMQYNGGVNTPHFEFAGTDLFFRTRRLVIDQQDDYLGFDVEYSQDALFENVIISRTFPFVLSEVLGATPGGAALENNMLDALEATALSLSHHSGSIKQ